MRYAAFLFICLSFSLSVWAQDGLFWAAQVDAQGQVRFIRDVRPTPGAAANLTTPTRYLQIINGAVVKRSDATCAAIDQAIADAAAIAASNAIIEAQAAQAARQAAEAAAPFEVAKIKIIDALDAAGNLDAFVGFLAANPKIKLRWDAAVVLDSNDPMVTNAVQQLAPLLGGVAPIDFLRACKSDL